MAIFLDGEETVDGYQLSLEVNKDANFSELVDNRLFRWMLAYPFSWIERGHKAKARNALENIQGRLGDLLDLTQQEFDDKYGDTKYEFDEGEFKEYKRAFFQTMSATTIPAIIAELVTKELLSEKILPNIIISNMKEMDFTLGDLMDNNKLQRMATGKKIKRNKKDKKGIFKPGLPHGARGEGRKEPYGPLQEGINPEKSAGLMGAFLESRPILYEEIRSHIKVDGHEIKFDTEKYISQLSESEGYGKLDDSEFVVASPRKSSAVEENVEIFSIDKTNDGRYRIEGFGKTRLVDDIDEAWDVYRNATDIDKLEKHIENTILSQKKSPLSDVLYAVVEPEDRMLDVGNLVIQVDQLSQGEKGRAGFGKTDPISKKSWINWVRALEGKVAHSNEKVGEIDNLLTIAFDLFSQDEKFSVLDEHPQMNKVRKLNEGLFDDLEIEELYDIWEDAGKPSAMDDEKIDDLANALWRHAMGKDEIGLERDGGDTYPVLSRGKKRKGMVRLRVSFTPTKLVSARTYEMWTPDRDYKKKKITGRRKRGHLGGKGPQTARPLEGQTMKDKNKDFKTLMDLKLGYNRLKGLVN